ncbi:hypothetical protein ABZ816_15635 [Actinosynnema sp. NPDC047251]|uniref:hypothetical protein n=1 Tax=Saccharothrix espanaensis TaxID=103731 RepID=UPI00059B9CD5|nr:hypothetical protein [Saccharothrix espanaensis]
MHKRVVMVVSGALFALLALVATVVTDLYDREYPQAIGVAERIGLDFGSSRFGDVEAFDRLAELDADLGLGLVKIAPDLTGGGAVDRKVFVAFTPGALPGEFRWFGGGVAEVVGRERLANSYASGSYLVTRPGARVDAFAGALTEAGVKVQVRVASVAESVDFVLGEGSFLAALLAAFALIVALALFWLSMKARGRALRVLAGSPVWRIQVQDLAGFVGGLLVSGAVVLVAAGLYVGLAHDWLYVGPFVRVLLGLQLAVIGAAMAAVLLMSASAWPSARMLATRQPAVRSLRTAVVVVQAATFLLVVSSAGPAWTAYRQASATAAETAMWQRLSDQVGITFGVSEREMVAVEPRIGDLVGDAEERDALAFSYTFGEQNRLPGLTDYPAASLVNQRWLDLVTEGAPRPALEPVPREEALRNGSGLAANLELWSRDRLPGEQVLGGFEFFRPVTDYRLPVATAGGGGQLDFLDDVLVVVVPSVRSAFNDSNLTSMMSTRNVVLTGVGGTQELMKRHGLDLKSLRDRDVKGVLRVVYIAEDGLLLAQFTAYVTWLLNLSLVALVVAFAVAAGISALITALLHAKRDFPLRVAGRSWAQILRGRVARELLAGVGLVVISLLFQQPGAMGAVLVVAAFGLLAVALSHLFAARWCFAGVGRRRI